MIVEASSAYAMLIADYANRDRHVSLVHELERKGDVAAQRTFDLLDKTFITPFDREDIAHLTQRMDDVVDEIDAAAKRLVLYEVPSPRRPLMDQVQALVGASAHVQIAVSSLLHLRNPQGLHETLAEIHRYEKRADDVHHAAVAELFRSTSDALEVIKWKEIYALTEKAVDRCDDIGNAIRSIMLKNG